MQKIIYKGHFVGTYLGENIGPQASSFYKYHNPYMLARLRIRIALYGTQNH